MNYQFKNSSMYCDRPGFGQSRTGTDEMAAVAMLDDKARIEPGGEPVHAHIP